MMKILHTAEAPGCEQMIEEMKQYAGIADDSRDAMLHNLFNAAVRRVQEYADKALVKSTVVLTVDLDETGRMARLYMGGGEIVRVEDSRGNAVPYEAVSKGMLKVSGNGVVEIEYVTDPSEADFDECKMTVYRYATAMFDGEPTDVLNSILNEVL